MKFVNLILILAEQFQPVSKLFSSYFILNSFYNIVIIRLHVIDGLFRISYITT